MKNKLFLRSVAVCMALLVALAPVNAYAATILKRGSQGSEVKQIQTTLKELGYYTYSKTTGYYGRVTEDAVKRFQKANGLSADGVVGKKTKSVILSRSKSISTTKVTNTTKTITTEKTTITTKESGITTLSAVSGTALKVINPDPNYNGDLDWYNKVQHIWEKGMVAVVTDVDTGKSFELKRTYGTNHADVEPLTKEDTAIIKEIWGGFSWERRAVIVQVGNYTIAGSMTAMPHAGVDSQPAGKYVSNRSGGYGSGVNLDAVKNNGCSGHMDIHFKNSRTHGTNTKQKSQQDMVAKSAKYIEELK